MVKLNAWYCSHLDREEQKIFRIIEKACENHQKSVFLAGPVPFHKIQNAMDGLRKDRPDLFYVCLRKIRVAESSLGTEVMLIYPYGDQTEKRIREVNQAADSILQEMKKQLGSGHQDTEQQKIRFLHNWLVNRCRYRCLQGEADADISGPLLEHAGICEGFSKTLAFLLRKSGVNAMVVNGYSFRPGQNRRCEEPGHSWNVVEVDGECFHVDATWDLCLTESSGFVRYDYFCLSEAQIGKDHQAFCAPPCLSDRKSFFASCSLQFDSEEELCRFFRRRSSLENFCYFRLTETLRKKLKEKYPEESDFLQACFSRLSGHSFKVQKNSIQNIFVIRKC